MQPLGSLLATTLHSIPKCTKMQRPAAMLAASKERFAARVPLICTIVVLSVVCIYQLQSDKCAQQKRRGRAIA